ncbi:hypothetical protein G7Y89_g8123 [Cudoniella acicularis]|uniref:Uncharacterized protein n=1 Tax=Cudoniella acicularis TaxID=354080 RepID=A0A8H4RIQ3_9HELO|nr:hypothetical protein G7Y89_g8123 [Cudoniella acicularis]
MSKQFASSRGFRIECFKGPRVLLELADGSQLKFVGKVGTTLRLDNDSAPINFVFGVVENASGDIILGGQFLHQHRILIRNKYLLQVIDDCERSDYVPDQKHVIPCYLNGERADAILDPGHFGGNTMSHSYALRNAHQIDASNCPEIELRGNKTHRESEGVVTVDAFHLGRHSGTAIPMEFIIATKARIKTSQSATTPS